MAVTFPTTLDSFTDRNSGDTISEDHMNDVQDAIELLEAKVGINTSAVTASIDYKVNKFFVAATHVFFAQATPPTGWTIDTAHKDNVLACKADSGVYSVVGADKGSFAIVTANIQAHAHTITHTHNGSISVNDSVSTGLRAPVANAGTRTNCQNIVTGSADGSYGTTGGTNTANSGNAGGADGLYRPKATVGVIATWS